MSIFITIALIYIYYTEVYILQMEQALFLESPRSSSQILFTHETMET